MLSVLSSYMFLLNLVLMISLHNLTLYPVWMCTERTMCQLLGGLAWVDWVPATGVGPSAAGPWLGYQVGRGSVLGGCGVPAAQTCECCAFAGSTKTDQSASRRLVGWARGPESGQGYWQGREAVPALWGSMNMRVLVNAQCVVCVPALVTSCLWQPERRRGHGCLCVLRESSMWVLSTAAPRLGDWPCQCPLRRCVCACASLGCVLSFARSCTCKRKSGSCIPQPGQRLQIPRHRAGLQQPGRTVLVVLVWAPAAW